jgi:hypothetical protein
MLIMPDHGEYAGERGASQQQNDVNSAAVNVGFAVSNSL